jgi:hypothetical protein
MLVAGGQSNQELSLAILFHQLLRLVLLRLRDQSATLEMVWKRIALLRELGLGPKQAKLRQKLDRSNFDPEELELS